MGIERLMSTWAHRARILAIDFGTKRLGLAVSDPLGITAQGLPTRERTSLDDDLDYLSKLAAEYAVERILVGNPLGQAANETAMSGRAAAFAAKLRKRVGCPVELWDERLTTAQAGRILRESGIGIEKRRRAADRVAASLLLQGYLDYQASRGAAGGSHSGAEDVKMSPAQDHTARRASGSRLSDDGETVSESAGSDRSEAAEAVKAPQSKSDSR